MRKRRGDPFDNLDIGEVQLCDHDPWDLPGLSKNKSKDKIWYFFCLHEQYQKNSRLNKRQTPTGHWKPTGETHLVTHEESDEEIGIKRILVFENPGATQWVIHEYEYTAELNSPIQGNFVLCKLMIKTNKKKKVIKKKKKAEPDCKNARPNKKARKSKSDCNMASASASAVENSNSKRVMADSAHGDGEPSKHMISDVDHQNSSTNAVFATYELRCPVASDMKDHSPNEMTPMSSYMKSTPSFPRASGLENQNSYEMTIVSTNNEGYETNCLKTFGCKNQNPGKNIDISASTEGKWSSLLEMPSDSDNQNHFTETDMSFPKDYVSPSMASNVGEATFQEVQSQHKGTDTLILDDHRDISTAFSTQEGGEAMLKKVQNQYDKDMAIREDNYPWMASDAGEDTFPKIDPLVEEDLRAFCELLDCLNSAPE